MKWNIKKVKVKDLVENPKNPRQLTEKGLKDLENSIKKFGVAEPLVCNTDLMICGGHGRKKILERLNILEVDCYLPEKKLTKKQFDELGIRLNKNIAGEFDFDILANEFEIEELLEWGFEEKELDLNLWNDTDESKLDEVPEVPKKAISKLGDLFLIDGKHRVMCGSSLKEDDTDKLFGGNKCDMIFTDPPYGVSYSDKNKFLNNLDKGNHNQKEIENDHMSEDDTNDFWYNYFMVIKKYLSKVHSYYIFSPQIQGMMMMMMMMMKAEMPYRHVLIWVKNNHVLGRTDYNYKHEPILFGWKRDGTHKFYGAGEKKFSVWDYNKPHKSDLHPTMKPVELIVNAILNSSEMGMIVCDSFLGSGTTLIACEQTKRICYGMEIDPLYIDVILKRYKKLYPDSKFECLNRKFDFEKLFEESELKKVG